MEPRWIVGFFVSLVLGAAAVSLFVWLLRWWLGIPRKRAEGGPGVPTWLTGTVERLFFTALVAFEVSGFPTAMVGWLAVKIASNWNRVGATNDAAARAYAMSALLAGLLSMFFACIGGWICSGDIRPNWLLR
jgi:hypothetical protein